MKVAIPTFEDRVSPRLEAAPEVCIVDLDETPARTDSGPGLAVGLVSWLDALERAGVEWVLCGAVSPALVQVFTSRGLRVRAGVAGDVEAVVEALQGGELTLNETASFSVWSVPGPRGCGCLGPFGHRRGPGRKGRGHGGGRRPRYRPAGPLAGGV